MKSVSFLGTGARLAHSTQTNAVIQSIPVQHQVPVIAFNVVVIRWLISHILPTQPQALAAFPIAQVPRHPGAKAAKPGFDLERVLG